MAAMIPREKFCCEHRALDHARDGKVAGAPCSVTGCACRGWVRRDTRGQRGRGLVRRSGNKPRGT